MSIIVLRREARGRTRERHRESAARDDVYNLGRFIRNLCQASRGLFHARGTPVFNVSK